MDFFKRLSKLIEANLNAWLDQAENPEKMREQAILDLTAAQKKAQALLVQAKSALKLAEKKLAEQLKDIEILFISAENHIKNHNESSAKEVLEERQRLIHEAEEKQKEIQEGAEHLDTLQRGIAAVNTKIADLKGIRPSRSHIAKSSVQKQSKTQDEKLSLDTSSFDTFNRMAEKVEWREAEVQALFSLLEEEQQKARLEQLGKKEQIEKDLARLKEHAKAAPLSSAASPSDDSAAILKEIEELKRKFNVE